MTSLLPFRWHIAEVLVIVAAGVAHHVVVTSKRERRLAAWALIALLVVTVWPIGDLAASVSLTVATVQRLVIMLLVAPLLLMATPTNVLARLTRPRPIDATTRLLSHPGFAVVVVTALGTLTLTTPVVDWGAHSSVGRDLVLIAVLFVGVVLWIPALGVMPGARRMSPAARAGYVFASALVVTSLSFVWIFSQHSLYPALHHQHALLHMTPLLDQQLAGFVAKLGCYMPMWAVAFTIFWHAEDRGTPIEETPLHWADVERHLLRVDRQRERAIRRHQPE
ncbi:MAG TPA: cytochrome c oxidase assembly protein [Acidimicrobiales bacterium]